MVIEYLAFLFRIIFQSIMGVFIKYDYQRENMLLIKEIQILKRKKKKIKFTDLDKFFYIAIYHNYKKLMDKIIIVKPATIISWHRKLVKRKWNYSQGRVGRPPVEKKIKLLIINMKRANPRWGAKKIKGELKKLGIKLCKRTVSNILKEYGFDLGKKITSYSWFKFLKSQGKRFMACDFFTVETMFLKRLYVFFVIDTETREIILFNVTSNPCEYWLKNVIRSYFPFMDNLPDVLVSDRDGIYGKWLNPFLKDYYEIKLIKTPPQMPICNPFAERMVRTFRGEVCDHVFIYNEKDLYRVFKEYIEYYNEERTHSSLDFNAPQNKFSYSDQIFHPGKVRKKKILDGLITDFKFAA